MRYVVLAAAMLLPLSAMGQSCVPRTDEQLNAMTDAELKATYCAARAEGAVNSGMETVPRTDERGMPIVTPAPNPCLTEAFQLVRTMEKRKIDVDKMLEECRTQ